MIKLLQELLGVIAELDRDAVPYALCGGLAVAVHGHPRATKDMDLLILERDLERARAAVKRAGFTLPALPMTFRRPDGAKQVIHRIPKIVDEDPLTVDLLIVGPELEGVFADRETYELQRRRIVAVSRSGLAKMKRTAGRPQDIADLDKLGFKNDE